MQGNFICRIDDQGLTENKNGTPQVFLKFAVLLECKEDGTRDPVEGTNFRTCWMPLTEKAASWVSEALSHIGFSGPPSAIDLENPNCCDMRGTECEFYARMDGDFEKWSISTPRASKSPAKKKLDGSRVMELDALFGDKFKSSGGDTTSPVTSDSGNNQF